MGFPSCGHIQEFVRGKTIDCLEAPAGGAIIIFHFTDGESLKLVMVAEVPQRPNIITIATPFGVEGTVKQSTTIMKAAQAEGGE
ncbi:hypothetical protein LCGC14_0428790 [marine sediment metagenome]|uniref:Uncharacterized protein n=1 Tax=marine sediment metagenome TaxID=412755 RepID=A0A0F9VAL7_9ZZZZ